MKKATLLKLWPLLAVALASNALDASVLPADRIAPWELAGIPGGIPNYAVSVDVTAFGAVGDGVADDTTAIRDAIEACPPGSAVYLPDGTYRLTETLDLQKSIVLRGESRLGTILSMDHTGDGIFLGTYTGGSSEFAIVDGFEKGSTVLTLAGISSTKFVPGKVVDIRQDNDPAVYQPGTKGYNSWTDRQTGMVNEIVAVNGTQVTLRLPLILNYAPTFNPTMRAQDGVHDAGIENLTILRPINDSTGSGNNILFYGAIRCWVKDIWSEKTYAHHIRLMRSQQCEIRGNIVNDTWIDTGGMGYGVAVQDRSTLNLIEDNAGSHLRHSYSVQIGATGNVFGYNFSRDPYSSESPNWIFTDLLAHGSMANFTLWEGNKVAQIRIDNIHGSNPWNIAFRNFATRPKSNHQGAIVGLTSNGCSLIANILGTAASSGDAIDIATEVAATTIVTGNLNGYTGVATWDPAYGTSLPASLYRATKPAFLGARSWPMFDPGIGAPDTLPAEDRWYALSGTTPPAQPPVAVDPNAPPPDTGTALVARYDCNASGQDTLLDLSDNQLDGVIAGATYAGGSHDGSDCLVFDGNDDGVTVANQSVLNITGAISMAGWVNTADATRHQSLIGKNSAYYLQLYGGASGARVRVGLLIDGGWATYTAPTASAIASNTWAHVAATYDGAEIKVYVNGAHVGTSARTGAIAVSNKALELGTIWNAYRLEGRLDDVALLDTALDATDIQLLYTGVGPTAPVAHYDFNASGHDTLLDLSDNQLDGVIAGATYAGGSHDGSDSLVFDGNDDGVTVAHQSALDLTNAVTMAAWVNTTDATRHQSIIAKNSAYYLQLYGGASGARVRLGLLINGGWSTYTAPATSLITNGNWSHVAATYDGAAIKVYVNGALIGTSARTGLITVSNKALELGTVWGGYRFEGRLDDIALFDEALDATEIQQLYTGP